MAKDHLKPITTKETQQRGIEVQDMPEQFWYALTGYHPLGQAVDFRKTGEHTDYDTLNAREQLIYLLASFTDQNNHFLPPEKIETKYLIGLVNLVHDMSCWLSENSIKHGTYPDDPAMLWREIEAAIGPDDMANCLGMIDKYAFQNQFVPDDLKVSFLDVLGDLGFPSLVDNAELLQIKSFASQSPFHEAILWSRWQWPCEQFHSHACLEVVRTSIPGSERERVAVETLIRLDALPQIDPQTMNRWYRTQIAQATPAERRIHLSLLSFHPTGRTYLLNQLKSKSDTQKIQTAVAKTLEQRARATLQTGRFDFIPQTRCQEILNTTQQILNTDQ
ncbi:hypothetical protein [Gimesia panareensis]|uniref:hypothetical protein n=1 Tax=Gimesia panareensis TaxID=2527978 RepID=UPI0011A27C9C|nr:hypothetical protein [Gimesia panareensis]